MDENCFHTYFKVKKIRGRNETDIYKNYSKDLPKERLEKFFAIHFDNAKLCAKDDVLAGKFRQHGNDASKRGAYLDALTFLNRSLCCASYNGEAYGFALANRSQNFLELGDFENCIKDIDLCLKAKYPEILKPALWIRKAECLNRLGRYLEMKTVLLDLLQLMDEMKGLTQEVAEKYKKSVMNMLKSTKSLIMDCNNSSCDNEMTRIPEMTENESFLYASAKIELRYTKRLGKHVVAAKEIAKGETLFLEKAYAVAPSYNTDGFSNMSANFCYYCLADLDNCIPCKKCITVYCNEKCRDAAWNEYHRWECLAVQINLFKYMKKAHLPLRIVIKAAHKGFDYVSTVSECDMSTFGDKINNYPYVYNSSSNINRFSKNDLMQLAAIATLLVNYLKLKTDFFKWLTKQPGCGEKEEAVLLNEVGALILRHCAELPQRYLTIKSYDSSTLVDEECCPISTDIACAICPSVVTMRHSCVSNTAQYFIGDTVVIKALTDISPNQELFMSYLEINYITMNTQERQNSLERNCIQNCKCVACIDPTLDLRAFESFKCIKCGGRAPVVSMNKPMGRLDCSCHHCNFKFILPSEIMQQIETYNQVWSKFLNTKDIKHLEECLDICKNVYSRSHKVFNTLYWQLLKSHVDKGNLFEAVRVGISLREFAYGRVIYNTAFECGIQLYLVCKIILEQVKDTLALTMDLQELGESIANVSSFLDEVKLIFELHYPPSVSHIQKLQFLLEVYITIYSKRMDEPPELLPK